MSVTARCKRESRNISRARLQCRRYSAHMLITVFTESDPVLSSLASAMSTVLRRMPCEAKIYWTVSQRRRPHLLPRRCVSCNRNNVFQCYEYLVFNLIDAVTSKIHCLVRNLFINAEEWRYMYRARCLQNVSFNSPNKRSFVNCK